jgi:transcriptional regulator with XRE-family HTH domain
MSQNTTTVLNKVNTKVVCFFNTTVLNSQTMKLTYGDRLRAARKHKGYTQTQLEENSGVPQGTISKIERGGQDSSAYDIKLAMACDVHPLWLSEGDERYIPAWLLLGTPKINEQSPGYQNPSQELEKNQPNTDLNNLMPTDSPATQDLVKTLEKGLKAGKIDEEYIKMLDTLTKKAMDDKNGKNR